MRFTFKGDGASPDTTVFGVTFPVGVAVPHTKVTDAQALLLAGNPMFEVSDDEPEPEPAAPVEPEPVVDPEPDADLGKKA